MWNVLEQCSWSVVHGSWWHSCLLWQVGLALLQPGQVTVKPQIGFVCRALFLLTKYMSHPWSSSLECKTRSTLLNFGTVEDEAVAFFPSGSIGIAVIHVSFELMPQSLCCSDYSKHKVLWVNCFSHAPIGLKHLSPWGECRTILLLRWEFKLLPDTL